MQQTINSIWWQWGLGAWLIWVGTADAQITETTAAVGLSGAAVLAPGAEILLLSIGLTGTGVETLDSLTVTLADLSAATGIDTSDIDSLKLYVSTDATLSSATDVLLAALTGASLTFGSATTLAPASGHAPPNGSERFYLVAVRLDSTVGDGRAFKIGFAAGGASTSQGGIGTAVVASDADKITIAVTATQLVFAQAPADAGTADANDEVVSGKDFSTQPIVEAQDVSGNVDVDFSEDLTITVTAGAGTLGGVASRTLTSGRADFVGNGLSYRATVDGEAFTLTADDATGGTDLTAGSTVGLSADVVASKLIFTRQPTLLLDPGANFAVDSVQVSAQDANGLVDADYGARIRVQAVRAENTNSAVGGLTAAPGDSVVAANGVATWTELKLPVADLIKLKATSGSLSSALSATVALPGVLTVGLADSLLADNALAGLAGVGGDRLVFTVLALHALGERMPLKTLKVKPTFTGMESGELRDLDLILDENADGLVGTTERSVLAAAVNSAGSGVELTLTAVDTLPADTTRHYLLVANISHPVRSIDALRIDLTDIAVGNGLATGVSPSVPVRSVVGRTHMVTGEVSIVSVDLETPRVGQSGKVTIVFDTVSDLAVGDEVVIEFPPAFDLAAIVVDQATTTPSGVDPSIGDDSSGLTAVVSLAAAETRGRYQIVLGGVKNPSSDQGAAPISVHTRLADNTIVDAIDPTQPGIVLQGSGRIALSAIELANGSVGQVGRMTLTFTTFTELGVGDEFKLVFASGFDVSEASVDAATKTLSSSDPLVDTTLSTDQELVIDLQASEAAGEVVLVLEGIAFPATAVQGVTVELRSRQDDGLDLDLPDLDPAVFAVAGRLQLAAGTSLDNALEGLAGVGGNRLVVAAFNLEATGEAVSVREVELLPHLVGVNSGEIFAFDLIYDADADGLVDADEPTVTVGPVDYGGAGVSLRVLLQDQVVPAGASRSYLVVADIGDGIDANDQIQVDVTDVVVADGPLSGVAPVITGGAVIGMAHRATGDVDLKLVILENGQTGGSGTVELAFATVSALAAGDRLVLEFPSGFDLSLASIDTGSNTPSGMLPVKVVGRSTRQMLVFALAADEEAGEFAIRLQDVINPARAASGLSVLIRTERADGTVVDGPDPDPLPFAIVKTALPLACKADFDADGRVYFSDLFRFGDAFGATGSSVYDLDGDGEVSFSDFFALTEVFGQRCNAADVDPVDGTVLELELMAELPGGKTMAFALVRAGAFTQGSPAEEQGRGKDEGPQRSVEISQPFYLGQFEVTQGQWRAVMGTALWQGLPAATDSTGHPAVYISWNDALAFVQALNAAAGDSLYRLPTEAEWEYAARAGTVTRWSFGDAELDLADYAWTRRVPAVVSELVTHPVGGKRPNPWTFYDMHGSTAEWVGDYYGAYDAAAARDPQGPSSGSARVLRGGGLTLSAAETRSAARFSFAADVRLSTFGFRIVRRIK